ncbi:MAG: hypothetical protein COT85_00290 [Chlamydiae bacterium CG10_big_fil_rev_8_21_14_0_10_42_34]|nr:MAG: hypothetical protein COT85_00290 [Chlamydiae bacterium CG10_big_fil_rev_8_21_14_0_10_42_34]
MTVAASLPYMSIQTHPFSGWQIQSIAISQKGEYSLVTACFYAALQRISSEQLRTLEALQIEKITYSLKELAIEFFFHLTEKRNQFFDKIRCFVQKHTEEDTGIVKRQNSPFSQWEIVEYKENKKKPNEIIAIFKNIEKRNEIFYNLDLLPTYGMDSLSLIPRSDQTIFRFASLEEKNIFKANALQQTLMNLS